MAVAMVDTVAIIHLTMEGK